MFCFWVVRLKRLFHEERKRALNRQMMKTILVIFIFFWSICFTKQKCKISKKFCFLDASVSAFGTTVTPVKKPPSSSTKHSSPSSSRYSYNYFEKKFNFSFFYRTNSTTSPKSTTLVPKASSPSSKTVKAKGHGIKMFNSTLKTNLKFLFF